MSDQHKTTLMQRLWDFRWRLAISVALPQVAIYGWWPAVFALIATCAAYRAGDDEHGKR